MTVDTGPAQGSPSKTPGIVIFVAVLNFLTAGLLLLSASVSLVVLIFGNVMGAYDFAQRQISQYYPNPGFNLGLNLLFALFLFLSVVFLSFFVFVAAGLLKAKRICWYLQIALCVMGIFAFPFGTVLNLVILIFFFQQNVRDYFKA